MSTPAARRARPAWRRGLGFARLSGITVLAVALAAPLAAQTSRATSVDEPPAIAIRGFGLVAGQEFSARTTFDAAFGHAFQPFWGGGGQVVFRDGIYVEFDASRFRKTGQRAFLFNNQIFPLGIPLTVTETPFELAGGYRLHRWRRVIPYAGVGVGSYGYREQSALADPSENLDTRHAGYLAVAGTEVRFSRWLGLGADVQYTRVPGILGTGGVSQQAHETSLGGIAARLKIVVGR